MRLGREGMHLGSDLTYAVRPKPLLNECTHGYLMRVASANGIGSVRQLFSSLRTRQQGAFDELCARLLLSEEDRAQLFGSLPAHWDHKDIPLGLAISDFNQTHGRWCPVCIREGGVLLGQWSLKLVCTCPKHCVWLQDVCPRCGASRTWSDVVKSQCICECGASLLSTNADEASKDVHALTLLLCGDPSPAERLASLSGLCTAATHRLVRYLGPFHADPKPSHPGQTLDVHRLEVARGLVTGAAALLSQWPTTMHSKIAELQPTAPKSPSVRRTFDPLYRVLYDAVMGSTGYPELHLGGMGMEGRILPNDAGLVRELDERVLALVADEFGHQQARMQLDRIVTVETGSRFLRIDAEGLVDFGPQGTAPARVEGLYDRAAGDWLRVAYALEPMPVTPADASTLSAPLPQQDPGPLALDEER